MFAGQCRQRGQRGIFHVPVTQRDERKRDAEKRVRRALVYARARALRLL